MVKQSGRSISELIELALEELADQEDQPLNAVVELQERGDVSVLDAARRLAQEDDPARRALAARVLGELGSPGRTFPEECGSILSRLALSDTDLSVKRSALFALGHLGYRKNESGLLSLETHSDEGIRYGLAFALNGSTDPSTVAVQLRLMDDSYEMVRDWATTSIGCTLALDGDSIRDALLKRIDDEDEIVRAEALHGLARRTDRRAIPALINEIGMEGERSHPDLFMDAARCLLQIPEQDNLTKSEILSRLAALGRVN
ncbi:HEAT repeat domain-containing protein [Aestuariivirga sp.]|uniref:HEAT repeat domain-containing protein n=1 Tax=Aestuariivirga sp. TaxID=2650926 RepID=UPI0039E6AAAD